MTATLIIVAVAVKGGKSLRTLFFGALEGIASLFAVNALGVFTGVTIGVNAVSLFISCLGGISGVIMLLIMNLIFL